MKFFTLTAFIIASLALSLQAQNSKSMTADEIVAKYTETIGGKANWDKIKNAKYESVILYGGQMEFPAVMVMEAPNKSRVDANVAGKAFIDAFDGNQAWSVNPFATGDKPQKKTAEESAEISENEFPEALVYYKERGHTIELLGTEDIEGAKTYKIKLTHGKTKSESIYFIDVENFVTIMARTFPKTGDAKGTTAETFFSDYQEVDGIMIPFSMTNKFNGQTAMVITVKKVTFNTTIDPKTFAFPE